MPRPHNPILCYVTDRKSIPGGEPELLPRIERAAAAHVDWIQIREKDLPAGRLAALTREALKRVAAGTSLNTARILVNDRLDVAIAAGARGVHLGEMSLPAVDVVRWLRSPAVRSAAGEDFLVGVSCHSVAAARSAEAAGADYVFFGPIFRTPSKVNYGAPQGLERLAEVTHALRVPVLAIGGVTTDNARFCLASGASGIAAIRLFQNASDLAVLVAHLRRGLTSPSK